MRNDPTQTSCLFMRAVSYATIGQFYKAVKVMTRVSKKTTKHQIFDFFDIRTNKNIRNVLVRRLVDEIILLHWALFDEIMMKNKKLDPGKIDLLYKMK